jgi:hypothetical protein
MIIEGLKQDIPRHAFLSHPAGELILYFVRAIQLSDGSFPDKHHTVYTFPLYVHDTCIIHSYLKLEYQEHNAESISSKNITLRMQHT